LAGDASVEARLRSRVHAVLGDDDGGQRWRLRRLSGRPASGVAPVSCGVFELVRRAVQETLAGRQVRLC